LKCNHDDAKPRRKARHGNTKTRKNRLRAFRRIGELQEAGGFIVWLRRIVIVPTRYPMCKQAWELEVEDDGQWLEVLAWGVFADEIVAYLGGDPSRHTAIGVGYGLERLAMVRYRIGDIRKIDVTNAA
jgi:phenylalanyl-tRNA synthetase alpha subunit